MEGENIPTTQTPAPSPAQSYAVPFAIIIAGLAIAGAIYFGDSKKAVVPLAATGDTKGSNVDPITPEDHILGNPDAKIIIVEYSDPECPFCKMFHPTMQRIMSDYGKSGKVAWVYRQFPIASLHPKAHYESEAIECANKVGGNTKFWEYLSKLFEITPGNNQLDPAELPKIAQTVGLDVTAFNKCLASGEMKAVVDKSIAGGEKAGLNGTPFSVVFIDKKPSLNINGAQPYESVKAGIEELLK